MLERYLTAEPTVVEAIANYIEVDHARETKAFLCGWVDQWDQLKTSQGKGRPRRSRPTPPWQSR